jgi:hypothetical protein
MATGIIWVFINRLGLPDAMDAEFAKRCSGSPARQKS